MPKVNKYEQIPSFRLAYRSKVFDGDIRNGYKEVFKYYERVFMIDENGERVENGKKDRNDDEYYLTARNTDEFFYFENGKVIDWDIPSFYKNYLGPINLEEYKRIKESQNEWVRNKFDIFTDEEIRKIKYYFRYLIDEFEFWFSSWGGGIPKINEEIGVDDLSVKEEENPPIFQFDFEKIRAFAAKLESSEAILYYFFILKEYDKEKRENYFLFMTDGEIEYCKIEFLRPHIMEEPPDFQLTGIGAKQSIAKENFEININNEIEFIKKKIELAKTLEKNEIINIEKLKREKIREESERILEQKNSDILLLKKVDKEKRLLEKKEGILPFENELNKIIYNKEYLKESIRKQKTIPAILLYLDVIERDLKSLLESTNKSTSPRILDIGEYLPEQYGPDDWRDEFCFNYEKTPIDIIMYDYHDKECTDAQAELEAGIWNKENVLDKKERNSYEKRYAKEISLIEKIYDAIGFIRHEREYYKEQFIKYPQISSNYEQEKIEQDLQIEKFEKLFAKNKLEKGKTIPNEILFKVAKEVGLEVPNEVEDFKTGAKSYQIAREYASRLGYKRKRRGGE